MVHRARAPGAAGLIVGGSHSIDALDDPRVADYRHIADAAYLQARSLFVAEGRLVVTRLLALPQWTTRSILVTQAAADSLGDRARSHQRADLPSPIKR